MTIPVAVVVDSFVEHTFDHHNYYFDKPIEVDIALVLDIHSGFVMEELMAFPDIVE
jgi:hypothetical protein